MSKLCLVVMLCLFAACFVGCQKAANVMPGNTDLEPVTIVSTTPEPSQEMLKGQTIVRRSDGSTVTLEGRFGKPDQTIAVQKNVLTYSGK